jgi:hypothetical protein
MSFMHAPAEQGYRAARSAQSERPHPRRAQPELRYRELTCDATQADPSRNLIRVSAFTPIVARRIGVAASKSCARNGAEAQECSRAPGQDCADVACRNLPLRKRMPCQDRHNPEIGTIGDPASPDAVPGEYRSRRATPSISAALRGG